MSRNLYDLLGLVSSVAFILALKGLSSPKSARRGNVIGAAGAGLATFVVFFYKSEEGSLHNLPWILGALAIGIAFGVPAARMVQMTQMPQMVALFNGVGGGAAALVAIVEYLNLGESASTLAVIATVFTVVVGCISFSGSIVTFLKLQELMTTRPVIFPGGRFVIGATLAGIFVNAGYVIIQGGNTLLELLAILSLIFGVLFVLPVGGADVPIVISLLNAFTGLTVAASGYVLENILLIVAGTLVGASGTILTRLMAVAMGRSVMGTLFGAFTAKAVSGSGEQESRPVRSGSPDDVAILLNYARRVVIVPGYGLAVAQAQHTIREMADLLSAKGIDVAYGIHPVAGRMPGHMNVLLAEANVPYDEVFELENINNDFSNTDVSFVIGANDVTNPAAKTDPKSPIFGMPILDVEKSKSVLFVKRGMAAGYAGVDNELFYKDNTLMLFSDAKKMVEEIIKNLD